MTLLKKVILSLFLLITIPEVVIGEAEVAEVDMDDDVGKNVMEIIQARGFFVEKYKVITADDYILTMYRIPKTYDESQSNEKPATDKPVVLLQHGLMDSSFTFVCNFRNQSLAFVLADAGEHLTYTDDDDEFWEFTWEDMGKYDLPAEINYILNKTGSSTLSYTPAGTSVKNMAHYAQNIRDNTFASYDYGCKCKRDLGIDDCSEKKCKNKKVYGSFDPPAFPIEKMVYPRTGFFIGSADTIATAADIERLRNALPSGTIVHELAVKEYSHLDLTWAYNANEKVYQDLLEQLDKYQGVGYTGDSVTSANMEANDDEFMLELLVQLLPDTMFASVDLSLALCYTKE
ncbi:Lysosomal acid Lipase/cholesteryl ester hydrolase, partial [Phytophthora palmivora]